MSCLECGKDSVIINGYMEAMCCDCYTRFIEEQEYGRRISEERNNEGFVE